MLQLVPEAHNKSGVVLVPDDVIIPGPEDKFVPMELARASKVGLVWFVERFCASIAHLHHSVLCCLLNAVGVVY